MPGNILTISGTLFSTTMEENHVTIGEIPCVVTGSTATSITCTVGVGPVRAFPVIVSVDGKGFASNTADNFTYIGGISSVSPTEAALGGNSMNMKKTLAKNSLFPIMWPWYYYSCYWS